MQNKHDKQAREAAAYASMVASAERNNEALAAAAREATVEGRNATERDAAIHAAALAARTG